MVKENSTVKKEDTTNVQNGSLKAHRGTFPELREPDAFSRRTADGGDVGKGGR